MTLQRVLCATPFAWDRIPSEHLDSLCSRATVVVSEARDALFRRGENNRGIFVVKHGEYKISMISPEGREQIVFIMREGRLITEGFVNARGRCKASCFSTGEASAWHLSAAVLDEASQSCAAVNWALLETLAFRQSRMLDLIYNLSLRSVDQRLAAFLLFLSAQAGPEKDVDGVILERDLDVQTVAALLGTTREEITRAQKKLREMGLIEITRSQIVIINRGGLEEII